MRLPSCWPCFDGRMNGCFIEELRFQTSQLLGKGSWHESSRPVDGVDIKFCLRLACEPPVPGSSEIPDERERGVYAIP